MPSRSIGPRLKSGGFYKKRPAYTKRVPKATPGLTKLVKNIVKAQEETKFAKEDVIPYVAFNSGISSTADIYRIIPSVVLGNTQSTRVGEKITPTKLTLKIMLGFSDRDAQARDITAHVFVLRSKAVKCDRLKAQIPIGDLMNGGNTNSVQFDGTYPRAHLPVELQNFTVLNHKTILLQKVNQTPGFVASQNSNTHRHLSINVKCGALKYDDSLDTNYPGNDYPFVCIGYTYNTPTQSPDALSGCLQVQATSCMFYKDA